MVLLVSVRFFFLCMRSVLLGVGIPSGVVAAGESDLLCLSPWGTCTPSSPLGVTTSVENLG